MLTSADGGFGNGKNKSLNVDKQPINMDVLLTTLSSLGGVKVPKILEPCTETLCSNTKCDRNDEAKVKNNPNIPHSPGYSHDRGGKVIEVDCDKQKNK
jgi:hypothetical protein